MKDEILEKLKEIELLILADKTIKSSESFRFHEWIDKMQGRNVDCEPWDFNRLCNPKSYATYRTIVCMVEDLYGQENGGNREYEKNKPEIQKMIKTIVAMTMFYQEQI